MIFGNWNPFKKTESTVMQPTIATVNNYGSNKNVTTGKELFKKSLISGFE